MSPSDLLPAVHALPLGDKHRLMQVLVGDLSSDQGELVSADSTEHSIWSPHDAFDAAATLLHVLNADTTARS